ncbi:beta-carotene 15,15'-dioxygenase, Brp/Blh family [Hymenobacter sp. BRD128]|uniref:Brp/Blh family beta-carotene 15,15'-dioxygenase n=1 Tax=Hymenobacter sp. BRD128 TaxID=2675878 RepID=UPI0015633A5D|nr:Brp/Blh family beta-carotene 15,15'-dioxygenase [Hymenobacter sp. BRD128]QKG57692.1 beta-carotene 15,15'-dioxygenase, Brp/Blh family [Hymenobacter sp. BRD128]
MPALPVAKSFPQYFSYLAVAGASGVGLVFPGAAPAMLGPILLVGLVVLGLAHGACDQLVLPAIRQINGGQRVYLVRFVLGYLSLAAVAGLGWWYWPGAAVSAFFLLTVWHWGSADAPARPGQRALWLLHSLLRGALLLAVPARWWPAEMQYSVNGLLAFAGAAPLSPAWLAGMAHGLWPVVGIGHLVLWACYAKQQEAQRCYTDAFEVLLLSTLFITVPPMLSLGVYFVFWHSLQHILRLNRVFGYVAAGPRRTWAALGQEVVFFIRRAFPLLLLSLAVPLALYLLLPTRLAALDTLLGIAVVTAAILTLPHALLVSVALDAGKWRAAKNRP